VDKSSKLVAIGLRAKTGRAIAVVLSGAADAPTLLAKTEIKLWDPKVPATGQPYHEVMDLPWAESQRAVQKFARAIEKIATKALTKIIIEQQSNGRRVAGVGIVGASDRDLTRIGNPHIRAHAAEGILFRRVLNLAAEVNGLKWRVFPDRQFEQLVNVELGSAGAGVTKKLNEIGRTLPPPWRQDQKQAATAAWLVLHKMNRTK
jgi:hypothetical protein